MKQKIKEKTKEAFAAVLPITGIVLILSIIMVPMELGTFVMFLTGAVMLVIGMGLFQLGAEMSMTPIGEGIGVTIAKVPNTVLAALIGFLMGTIITLAEPDLQVLANQVPSIPNRVLTWSVSVGVGIFLASAILRILHRISLSTMLAVFYAILIAVSFFVPKDFLAVSFDAGGVTTGPITVPFIMAMGVGMTRVRSDKDAADDSFGLVALSSVGPILAVLMLGIFYHPEETAYTASAVANVTTTQDVAREFLHTLPSFAKEVLFSLLPIIAVFFAFQLLTKRYRRRQMKRILVGFSYTYLGLVLFLCGVNVGFSPVGTVLGSEMASTSMKWLLVPVGMLIGYYIVKAEPAIQILNRQVEDVTDGVVSATLMNRCMSLGVAVSVGLAMLRILLGFSIQWIIIPGYIIAILMSRLVPKIFVGIAFDSGGVASGPMTSTFLLPLSIGACTALGNNLMTDAFGVVALVALTPLIAIQIMGLMYRWNLHRAAKAALAGAVAAAADMDEDEIYELEEGTAIENGN